MAVLAAAAAAVLLTLLVTTTKAVQIDSCSAGRGPTTTPLHLSNLTVYGTPWGVFFAAVSNLSF